MKKFRYVEYTCKTIMYCEDSIEDITSIAIDNFHEMLNNEEIDIYHHAITPDNYKDSLDSANFDEGCIAYSLPGIDDEECTIRMTPEYVDELNKENKKLIKEILSKANMDLIAYNDKHKDPDINKVIKLISSASYKLD